MRHVFGPTLLALAFAAGCASAGAQIKEKFPTGYKRLVSVAPDCTEPTGDLVRHCTVAAEILQSKPEAALMLLVDHLGAEVKTIASKAEAERAKAIADLQKTAVAALKQTFTNVGDSYSNAMLKAIESVDLGSETVVNALKNASDAAKKLGSLLD